MAKKKAAATTTKKTTASKPKAAKKKTPATKSVGVIGSIIEFLTKATKTKPLTKEQLADQLEKRFPERGRDAMLRTINCQVPTRLRKEKELDVQRNDEKGGYWINK